MVLRRTCSLWKLDVWAIALTPGRQRVRSDPKRQKPPFTHRMYFFFAEECRLGSVKLFFTEPCSRRDRFFFFLSSFALPFPFRTVRTPRQLVPFPGIDATPLAFQILQLSDVGCTQLGTPVFRTLPSGSNYRAASRLRSVSSSLRGLNDACAGRRLVDLCF